MRDKFGLEFRIVDSEMMRILRRERGLHVNPWTHFPRLITSIDFLKRERPMRLFSEILPAEGESLYPRKFDLLILDEAHKARRRGGLGDKNNEPNNLLEFMVRIGRRTKNLLLGTATPIQTEVRELWDLLFGFAGEGMTLFVTTHYMDEAERCSHVGYIYMSKLIVCGEPDDLKKMPEVSPPGTRRLEVSCDHLTVALRAIHELEGVQSATVFGQSMHLLVEERVKRAEIEAKLSGVGIDHAEIREISPSLEDVFVTLSEKHAGEKQREKAA